VVPVQVARHVDVDHVPVFQWYVVRDAVAHDLVDTGARRPGETVVVQRRRVGAFGENQGVHFGIDGFGGGARLHPFLAGFQNIVDDGAGSPQLVDGGAGVLGDGARGGRGRGWVGDVGGEGGEKGGGDFAEAQGAGEEGFEEGHGGVGRVGWKGSGVG